MEEYEGHQGITLDEPSHFMPMESSPRHALVDPRHVDAAEEIMMKASVGSRAMGIPNKYWQTPANTDMAESIFSSEVPQGINIPLGKTAAMAFVSSEEHVTIQNQEPASTNLENMSNYSISQIDLPAQQQTELEKKYDCINAICNFEDEQFGDALLNKRKKEAPSTKGRTSSVFRAGSRQSRQSGRGSGRGDSATPDGGRDSASMLPRTTRPILNADMGKLSQQLDVVVERVDHLTSGSLPGGSDGTQNTQHDKGAGKRGALDMADLRSDVLSD